MEESPVANEGENPAGCRIITAADLVASDIPQPLRIAEGMLHEGLTIFAGVNGLGKSDLALIWAAVVSIGGTLCGCFPADPARVLYLALEDDDASLQNRLRRFPDRTQNVPLASLNQLHLCTSWPDFHAGGVQALSEWLSAHPDCRLVVIDDIRHFAPPLGRGRPRLDQPRDPMKELHDLARRHHVAILILYHTRPRPVSVNANPYAEIPPSLTAYADTLLYLFRNYTDEITLVLTGRDFGWKGVVIRIDNQFGAGALLVDENALSTQRSDIIHLLIESENPLSPDEVASALGIPRANAIQLLRKMHRSGLITEPEYGCYTFPLHGNRSSGVNRSPPR